MKTILLCDDSKLSSELLELKLKKYNCRIIGKAKNGQEGFELYQSLKPDLVFMDITMPVKDGKACTAEILKLNPKAQVIMLSAISDEGTINDCLKMGALGFVKKQSIANQQLFDEAIKQLPIQLEIAS